MKHLKNEAKTIDQNRLKADHTLIKNRSKNQPQINQKSTKINQKSTKIPPKIEVWKAPGQVWRRLGPAWAIQGVMRAIYLGPFWNRLGGLLGGLGPRKVANMGPTWYPKRSKNQLKIGPKINQFYDASWNQYLSVFQ